MRRYISTQVTFMTGEGADPIMQFKFQGTILKVHTPVKRLMQITQFVVPCCLALTLGFSK